MRRGWLRVVFARCREHHSFLPCDHRALSSGASAEIAGDADGQGVGRKERETKFAINKRNKVKLVASFKNKGDVLERLEVRKWMDLPEIVILGRTNSGKSSLISHLLGQPGRAKDSSRAGKTTSIDLYLVNDALILADVPGYGFEHKNSELEKKWERVWRPLITTYLSSTPSLRAALFLADIRWLPLEDDRLIVRALGEASIPPLLVLTKDDRITAGPGDAEEKRGILSVHETRLWLTARVRKVLDWPVARPHVHYSIVESPPRTKLRRWIDSLYRTTSREEASSLLDHAFKQREITAKCDSQKKLTEHQDMPNTESVVAKSRLEIRALTETIEQGGVGGEEGSTGGAGSSPIGRSRGK
jgi:ribosome biogenesis GTP-binding protein YsxC/EngB